MCNFNLRNGTNVALAIISNHEQHIRALGDVLVAIHYWPYILPCANTYQCIQAMSGRFGVTESTVMTNEPLGLGQSRDRSPIPA